MEKKIAVIGLGYVGLPLALEFSKKYPTIGYDINSTRIQELNDFTDSTKEIESLTLKDNCVKDKIDLNSRGKGLFFTNRIDELSEANFYIVTVPTPTDKNKRPVLTPLINASKTVGENLLPGNYVIYESTVYPGVTEDECVPVLESSSGLRYNEDFFVGYSPERINPGDKDKTVSKILKVTSGSNSHAAKIVDELYQSVIKAGTHLAPSIKVAEASKVIENSQRDINIAFVNELAKIFNKLNIDTHAVLEAANTKWNFLPFTPGLVGGHCIGVDPYYLAQKAEESGYYPEIILAGRRINDSMGSFVASEIVKKMVQNDIPIKGSKALLLGFTFKENCPDIRNTRVIDIYQDLVEFGLEVTIYDPWVNKMEALKEYGLIVENEYQTIEGRYASIILAVSHSEFLTIDISELKENKSIVYDIKGFLNHEIVDARL